MASSNNNADDAGGGAAELVCDGRVQVRICCYEFAMEQKSFRFPWRDAKSAEHLRDLVEQRMIVQCEIDILCGHGLGDFDQGMQQEDISVDDVFRLSLCAQRTSCCTRPTGSSIPTFVAPRCVIWVGAKVWWHNCC